MPKGKKPLMPKTTGSSPGVLFAKMISNVPSHVSGSTASPIASIGSFGGQQSILVSSSSPTIASSIASSSGGPSILKAKGSGAHLDLINSSVHLGAGDNFDDFNMLTNTAMASYSGYDGGQPAIKRRKQDPKTGKGLRHFSMKVCEKVKLKGTTTYNEVADELVAEFSADPIASRAAFHGGYLPGDQEPFDQKNIRRRVYDALNVLMAMNIISKEKKEIKWIGLPTNAAQECIELEQEKQKRLERIKVKKTQLRELLLQQVAFKNLVERNKNLSMYPATNAMINLPFIIVNTDKKTVIDCSISNDKTEYLFNFDNTFEIHDDIEVLKRMGMAFGLEKPDGPPPSRVNSEKARSMLPDALRCELDELVEEKHINQITVQTISSPIQGPSTSRGTGRNRH